MKTMRGIAAGTVLTSILITGSALPSGADDALTVATATASATANGQSTTTQRPAILEEQKDRILEFDRLLNEQRTRLGLKPLNFHPGTALAAQRDAASRHAYNGYTMPRDLATIWYSQELLRTTADVTDISGGVPSLPEDGTIPSYILALADPDMETYGMGYFVDQDGTVWVSIGLFEPIPGEGTLPNTYHSAADYFAGEPVIRPEFTDNKAGSAYYQPIRWMEAQELTHGYVDGSFGVTRKISRGETASFLYRLAQPNHTAPKKSPFPDVSTTNSHYPAITWMEKSGIVGGYSNGTFQPGRSITRGEMAKIIYGAFGEDGYNPSGSTFTDVGTKNTYYEAISWLKDNRIVVGYTKGDYRPSQEITRGEVAVILRNVAWHEEGRL